MSTTVENRVVKMQFDNATFKKEALATKGALDQVDAAVAKAGNSKGLLSMGNAMTTVKVKASAMQVAAVTAIANITNRAINAGITMAKSFTLDPIKQGFDEYELKMKSIQTILANTKGENLKSVSAALNELNIYSDKTIYNFANMTENIGKLTTAGISLKDSTAVVKGFHNMVALAGGDATAAAGAMEQFGQGLQAGTIKAMDWMSISNRGLGSQNLQKAFFESARAVGTLSDVPLTTTFDEWAKANGGFKASLEAGWLTTDVATTALSAVTGDVKNVQELMEQGFSRQAATDMLEIADNAVESATKIRTFSAFMDTTKEALASGWGQIMEVIFGDFNESTKLFTKLSEVTGKYIGAFFGYISRLINAFDKLGGRTAVLETIKNVLSPILAILGLIAKGFTMVFGGGDTGSGLATFAKALQHITRPLRILGLLISGQITPMEAFHRLTEVVSNGVRNLIKWVTGLIKPLRGIIDLKVPGTGPFVDFLNKIISVIRDAVGNIDRLVDKAGSVTDVFSKIKAPKLPDFGSMFGKDDPTSKLKGLTDGLSGITGFKAPTLSAPSLPDKPSGMMFNPDANLDTSRIQDASDAVKSAVDDLRTESEGAKTAGDVFMDTFSGILGGVKKFFSGFNFEDLMAGINLAVLGTFLVSASKMMNTFRKSFEGFVGIGESVNGVMSSASGAFDAFADGKKAKLIIAYAIAIGVLAAALWLLSRIPMKQLGTALAAMAGIMFIMKTGVDSITKSVEAMSGKGTALKLTGLSLALLALGIAVLTLSVAFLILNKVKWESMLKGLATIFVIMTLLERMGKVGESGAKNLMATSVALGALAISLVVIAGALMLFQLVKWEAMAKAGLTLGAITIALVALSKVPAKTLLGAAIAMTAISSGMLVLANALIIFQLVKWESMLKAAIVLAALTASVAALMWVGGGPVGAATIVAIAGAMVLLAAAGLMLNGVDWSSIGKVALILGVLVLGFGAFLAVISFFAPALILLSLFAGQLALLALAITGLALAFAVVFPLLALGTGAFAAFATGAAVAIGVFLTSLALQAPIIKKSLLVILQTMIDTIVEAVPMVIDGFKRLWAAIKAEFTGGGKSGGAKGVMTSMGKAGDGWMTKLVDAIKKKMPAIIDKAVEIGKKFISGLIKHAPAIAQKGAELVVALINGLASRIGSIVSAATDLIIRFAQGIGEGLDRIIKAGITLIANFLHDLASAIRNGSAAIGGGLKDVIDAMKDVGVNLVKGIITGLKSMVGDALGSIKDLAGDMIQAAKDKFKVFSPSRVFRDIGKFLVEGLTKGVQDNAASAVTAVASMVSGTIAVAGEYVDNFIQSLDQKALAASAKAYGLQQAAEKAAAAAEKTKKNKKDDRKANQLQKAADKAATVAEKREAAAEKARAARERADQFAEASLIEQAQMRAEDATMTLDDAKAAEFEAESKRQQAEALRAQAKKKGVSDKDAKKFRKQADDLEEGARRDAERANTLLETARTQAAEAMDLQKRAADAAVADFNKRYADEYESDRMEDEFNALTDEKKASKRREQAAALQGKADADLARARILAYTDLDAANELAEQALDGADQARDYLREAAELEKRVEEAKQAAADAKDSQSVDVGGEVVNLDPTEAAGIALGDYADVYNAAYAAAAGGVHTEFNQYNTSPEALNPTDVYRLSNNAFDWAANKLQPT